MAKRLLSGFVNLYIDETGKLVIKDEFIKFIGTSIDGVLTQPIVEAADVGTATIAGYLKIFVQDDGDQLTDQAYFIPIYTLA